MRFRHLASSVIVRRQGRRLVIQLTATLPRCVVGLAVAVRVLLADHLQAVGPRRRVSRGSSTENLLSHCRFWTC